MVSLQRFSRTTYFLFGKSNSELRIMVFGFGKKKEQLTDMTQREDQKEKHIK